MKRSNIVLFTSIAAIIEAIIICTVANETYRFTNSTLGFKYKALCVIMYIFAVIVSVWHLINITDESDHSKKKLYLKAFGENHVNFLFTYHFLLFAIAMFYFSEWTWCVMGCIMFWVHNYIHRDNQNKYALEYAIEEAKIAARKPVVLDRSDDLL